MKKIIASLIIVLFLSGCGPSKKNVWYDFTTKSGSSQKKKRAKIKTDLSPNSSASVFDEELDSFILLDDEFSLQDGFEVGSYEDVYLDEDDEITFVDDRDADVYNFKTVYYDFDKFNIRSDQKTIFVGNLRAIKKAIKEGKTVVIEGHADSAAGSRAYNLQLSQQRAQTAADWFINFKTKADSIKAIGRGSEMLIVSHGDKNEQAPNRRVEIYIISE